MRGFKEQEIITKNRKRETETETDRELINKKIYQKKSIGRQI